MKTPVIYVSIIGAALALGAVGGVVGKKLLGDESIVYEGDANSIDFQIEPVYKEYLSYSGDPLKKFTPAELINIGLENYRRCEKSYSVGIGVADTVVQQTIRNFQIRDGEQFFEESISNSSMVSLANRMWQTGKDGNIFICRGTADGAEKGNYPSNDTEYSQEDYTNLLGRTLDSMFIYTVTDSTVLTSDIDNKDGYVITVTLDPVVGPYHYKFQMKNISNLDALPTFESVKLTFTFDKNLMLQHLSVDETYNAKMVISVTIHNTIEYYYFPNQEMKIPDKSESLDYTAKGVIEQ